MAVGDGSRPRMARLLVWSLMLGLAALAGFLGPKLWAAAAKRGGAVAVLKRKTDQLLSFGRFRDRRIKAFVKTDASGKGAPPPRRGKVEIVPSN